MFCSFNEYIFWLFKHLVPALLSVNIIVEQGVDVFGFWSHWALSFGM